MASFKPSSDQIAAVRAAATNTRQASSMHILPPKIAAETQPSATKTESYPTIPPDWSYTTQEPAYLRDDPGLACLTSQLDRINEQLRYHEYFKRSVADAEEDCKRDLAASLARSLVSSSASQRSNYNSGNEGKLTSASGSNSLGAGYLGNGLNLDQWIKKWDPEVQAEYFFNLQTGEASWLDPRYGNIAA